jgi:hypothetical protein
MPLCCGAPPGYDRAPTNAEAGQPADKRPWTEYDASGNKQPKPEFKALSLTPCIWCGPTCCVFELQWCQACGDDADTTCDVICRCHTQRLKSCICFGPQCDEPLLPGCCYKSWHADGKVSIHECCQFDCMDGLCAMRYAGCQWACCHCTCVRCLPCCVGICSVCGGGEEELYMDGDLKPLPQVMQQV